MLIDFGQFLKLWELRTRCMSERTTFVNEKINVLRVSSFETGNKLDKIDILMKESDSKCLHEYNMLIKEIKETKETKTT